MDIKNLSFKILTLSLLMFFGSAAIFCTKLNDIKTEEGARGYAQRLSQQIEAALKKNAKTKEERERFYGSFTFGQRILCYYLSAFETTHGTVVRRDGDIVTETMEPLCSELKNDPTETQRELLTLAANIIASKIPCAQCKGLKPIINMNSEFTLPFNAMLTV